MADVSHWLKTSPTSLDVYHWSFPKSLLDCSHVIASTTGQQEKEGAKSQELRSEVTELKW